METGRDGPKIVSQIKHREEETASRGSKGPPPSYARLLLWLHSLPFMGHFSAAKGPHWLQEDETGGL